MSISYLVCQQHVSIRIAVTLRAWKPASFWKIAQLKFIEAVAVINTGLHSSLSNYPHGLHLALKTVFIERLLHIYSACEVIRASSSPSIINWSTGRLSYRYAPPHVPPELQQLFTEKLSVRSARQQASEQLLQARRMF